MALLVPESAQAIVELRHAHGLGYSADGNRILIPNHYGIAVYSEGRWSKVPGPAHDYMGFHGPLYNLGMPPMTMAFQVGDPVLLDRVSAGDKVRFSC